MDEYCAVAVGDGSFKYNGMLRFNETGKVMFECLQNDVTEEDIYIALSKEYDGNKEDMMKSIHSFVEKLESESVLED